jgi:hypothetical protein
MLDKKCSRGGCPVVYKRPTFRSVEYMATKSRSVGTLDGGAAHDKVRYGARSIMHEEVLDVRRIKEARMTSGSLRCTIPVHRGKSRGWSSTVLVHTVS